MKRIKNRMSNICCMYTWAEWMKKKKKIKVAHYKYYFRCFVLPFLFLLSLVIYVFFFSFQFGCVMYLWKKWRCTPILENVSLKFIAWHIAHAKFIPWNWDRLLYCLFLLYIFAVVCEKYFKFFSVNKRKTIELKRI